MDLHSKKVALTWLSERNWANPACVPYRAFSFLLPFLLLYHTPVLSFYCMKAGLKEGEGLKGQLLAADACSESGRLRNTFEVIGMTESSL